MLCRFYGSKVGCNRGSECRFAHDSSTKKFKNRETNLDATRVLAADLNGMRAALAAAGSIRNVHYKCNESLPSTQDERQMIKHLILSKNECGRGVDLPPERRSFIEARALELNFNIISAFSFRRQLIRQMVGPARFYMTNNAMGSPQEALAHATNLEDELAVWLHNNNIKFLRQNELTNLGLKSTPDFFITDELYINGRKVGWIDCKTYYGSRILADDWSLPIGKLHKQKTLYNELFGDGCFLFLSGWCKDLLTHPDFKDVLLLDGHQIDSDKLYRDDRTRVGESLGLAMMDE